MVTPSHTHTHITRCIPNREADATSIALDAAILSKEKKSQDGVLSVGNSAILLVLLLTALERSTATLKVF